MSLQSEQFAGNGLRKIGAGVGAGLATLGVSAALTYGYLQVRDYQESHRQWVKLQSLEKAGEYEGCLAQAQAIVPASRYFEGAQSLVQQCRLGRAQQQAEQQEYVAAIASALMIPKSSGDTYYQAQPFIQTWSDAVMQQGKDLLEAGQLEAAIAKLKLLPAESPVDKERETTIKRWQADWTQSKNAIQNRRRFLERGQWLSAKQSLASVASIGFWQRKAKPLIAKADAGIALVEQYAAEQYQQPPAALGRCTQCRLYAPRLGYSSGVFISPRRILATGSGCAPRPRSSPVALLRG
ncbi:MAG: hypothetical protein HC857_00435 [Synechococcales cyanobacterium RU_4_20]|nr:hypothetical protein [Synechococcales cyanobacterium RU_4_20]